MTGKPNLYGTSDHIAIFSTHAAMLTLKLKCLKIILGLEFWGATLILAPAEGSSLEP